jgi:hypothetical protein
VYLVDSCCKEVVVVDVKRTVEREGKFVRLLMSK